MAEEEKINPDVERLAKSYLNFEGNPDCLKDIKEWDPLRIDTMQVELKRANQEKDPAQRHYKLSQLHQSLRQDIDYFAGRILNPGAFEDRDAMERIKMYGAAGSSQTDDVINPKRV